METLEDIALGIAFGDQEFRCPFEHKPGGFKKQNEIPPEYENDSNPLGKALANVGERIDTLQMDAPIQSMTKEKRDQPSEPITVTRYGFSLHHLIPGNEMWNLL